MPGFQSTRLATEGALEPFFFLYTDDSIQGNPETCKQSSIMLNYEVKNKLLLFFTYASSYTMNKKQKSNNNLNECQPCLIFGKICPRNDTPNDCSYYPTN